MMGCGGDGFTLFRPVFRAVTVAAQRPHIAHTVHGHPFPFSVRHQENAWNSRRSLAPYQDTARRETYGSRGIPVDSGACLAVWRGFGVTEARARLTQKLRVPTVRHRLSP